MKTIQIKNCNNGSSCGSSYDKTVWWGSREEIKAGENKTIRMEPIVVGKIQLAKAA